jgi:hypothetical protein
MSTDYIQYGAKGCPLEEKLEALRQYDCIKSQLKSTGTDSPSSKKEPLSSHPYLYDLHYEIRSELEEIRAVMKSVPNNTDSTVYDEIEKLAKQFRATRNRRVIDDALTYYRGIAADYSRSYLPHQNIVDLSPPNSIGQQQSFHDSVQPSTVKPSPAPYYFVEEPCSAHYVPVSCESKSHNHMNGAQIYEGNLASPSEDSTVRVNALRHESSIPVACTSDELPDAYRIKERPHAKYDYLARYFPTKSNQEADNVVIKSKQEDNQLDRPVESPENLFKRYGLSSLIPRSLSEKDPGVIISDAYTSLLQHVNHTSKKARKKPLHPRPLPKSRGLRSSSTPQQIEKRNLSSLEQGSATFERYTASNGADTNSLDDDAVNAVTNEEPRLEVMNHPKLERVTPSPTDNKVLESTAQYSSTQNAKFSEGSNPIKTVESDSIALPQLIDEAILKPVLSQMNPEWCRKLFPP